MMLRVLNQFKRIYNDDGRDDKSFDLQDKRLQWSLSNLQQAIQMVVSRSQTLHDMMLSVTIRDRLH